MSCEQNLKVIIGLWDEIAIKMNAVTERLEILERIIKNKFPDDIYLERVKVIWKNEKNDITEEKP